MLDLNAVAPAPEPRYARGDVTRNIISGNEALILDVQQAFGVNLYTVLEKGFIYDEGCSDTPGAGTMPEVVLAPTDQRPFSEAEVIILTAVYAL